MITELDHYQQEAIKTRKPMSKADMDQYCTMKLCEEVGEITSIIAKHYYHGKEFNREDLKSELGDLAWYLTNLAYNNGFTLSEIATYNIEKLRQRHGEKYRQDFYTKDGNGNNFS